MTSPQLTKGIRRGDTGAGRESRQVKAKARQRIEEAADLMANELLGIASGR